MLLDCRFLPSHLALKPIAFLHLLIYFECVPVAVSWQKLVLSFHHLSTGNQTPGSSRVGTTTLTIPAISMAISAFQEVDSQLSLSGRIVQQMLEPVERSCQPVTAVLSSLPLTYTSSALGLKHGLTGG